MSYNLPIKLKISNLVLKNIRNISKKGNKTKKDKVWKQRMEQ